MEHKTDQKISGLKKSEFLSESRTRFFFGSSLLYILIISTSLKMNFP